MYFHEATYDLDILARQNLHIHSCFSKCANREMDFDAIVKSAENAGLEAIAITDHVMIEDDDFLRNIADLKAKAEKAQTDVKIMIGAELSAYGINKFTFQNEMPQLDYRLWAHNHYHVDGWEQPEDKSPVGYKNHIIAVLNSLIESDRADCIAHPFHDEYLIYYLMGAVSFEVGSVPNSFTENEIGDLFKKAQMHETAFELNFNIIPHFPEFYRMMYNIGRETGVMFNVGTDAHKLVNISTRSSLAEIKKILN